MVKLVSAIVLNYRSPQHVVRCVQALLQQQFQNSDFKIQTSKFDWLEIIVVDNDSDDESIGVIRNRLSAVPDVLILENHGNNGFGKGNELGIRRAQGEYLLIINPDNELNPDALSLMVDAMERDPSIGILAPQLVHEDGTVRDSYRTFPHLSDVIIKRTFLKKYFPDQLKNYLQSDSDPEICRNTDWVVGACLLMKKDFYRRIGGFDPRFFLFFEDIDLCRRCWLAGKRVVYFPQAKATDRKRRLSEGGVLSLAWNKTGRIHIASAIKYFWKWRSADGRNVSRAEKAGTTPNV